MRSSKKRKTETFLTCWEDEYESYQDLHFHDWDHLSGHERETNVNKHCDFCTFGLEMPFMEVHPTKPFA